MAERPWKFESSRPHQFSSYPVDFADAIQRLAADSRIILSDIAATQALAEHVELIEASIRDSHAARLSFAVDRDI